MNKKLIFLYSVIFFIIISTFTLIQGFIVVRDAFLLGLVFVISFVLYPKSFFNIPITILILYSGIVLIISPSANSIFKTNWFLSELLYLSTYYSIINIFQQYNSKGLKIVTKIGLSIIIIVSFITILVSFVDPESMRTLISTSGQEKLDILKENRRLGIASFGMIHSLPFLFPVLIYNLKKETRKKERLIYYASIIIMYFVIVRSFFAMPLILASFAIVFSFIVSVNQKRNIVLVFTFLLLLLFALNTTFLLSFLSSIIPMFANTGIDDKIQDIYKTIEQSKMTGQVAGRVELYDKSWDTFLINPLMGSRDHTDAGGHAFFTDHLAYFGLIGAIPYFLFFYYIFKKQYKRLKRETRVYYLISISAFFAMGFSKNFSGTETFLYCFIFLPGLYLTSKESIENEEMNYYH